MPDDNGRCLWHTVMKVENTGRQEQRDEREILN